LLREKLDSLTETKENNIESLQRRIQEHQNYIEKLQMEKQSLEYEVLVTKIKEVESDNSKLREKINSSQTNVGSFINEMSSILENHEFKDMLGSGIRDFDFNNFGMNEEYEHTQQHAGTGGSSKLRQARRNEEF